MTRDLFCRLANKRRVFLFVLAQLICCSAGKFGWHDKRATALIVYEFVRNLDCCEHKRAIGTRGAVTALEYDAPVVSHEAGRIKVLFHLSQYWASLGFKLC